MTAVEYLFQIFGQHTEVWRKEMEQALEMEKQQIIDAYQKGFTRERGNRDEDAEQYYSETYKKYNP
jgi:hypothetical protein